MFGAKVAKLAGAAMLALALAGCGGGGGGGHINSTPPPPPAPPPPPPPPPPQEPAGAWYDTSSSHSFTTLGSHAEHVASAGGDINSTLTTDQVRIEYSKAEGAYLVTLPGLPQGRLDDRNLVGSAGNVLGKVDLGQRSTGFTYANIAYWVVGDGTSDLKVGAFVFGTPTAAGDVPVTGSATYSGILSAQTDDAFVRPSEGFVTPVFMNGTVTMDFNFAAGTLAGNIAPVWNCWNCFETPIGTINFTDTVYSTGSTSYSGKFDTPLSGPNGFSGIFAGPGAAETMAKFQVPYLDPYTSDQHVMSGVWVAKTDH